jgi:hypothetical protein
MVAGAVAAMVLLGAESLHPAREFLDALQERSVVGRSVSTRELR